MEAGRQEGRVVLITGATGELGQPVAQAFAAQGDRLVLAARGQERLEAVVRALGVADDRVLAQAADVTNTGQVDALVKAALERWGRIDVLLNLAGGYQAGAPVAEMDEAFWDRMLNLNLRSVFLACRAVVPHMLQQGSGKIVNVAARAGLQGRAKSAAYAVAKGGVILLTQALAEEVKNAGINVNVVLPSIIDTPRNREENPKADFSKWVPPEQLAAVILYLCSDAASALNGATIPVYGRA
jgi:NAD(P)-dependent dehydrogenase (short-subunit alcohol dehydrogenase family)